jgi:hypothetical protein
MIVFDTDLDQIFLWDGGGWKTVDSGGLSGSGNDGELTLWGASNTLTSDADLFWDDTYKRLGIGTQAPSAALSLHSNADIAFDIKNNRGAPISEHIFGIESTNIPVATTDLINLKVPLGSPTDFQFLECEYGTSKVLKINGDGHLNATTIGCGTDDGSARFNIVDPSWDLKMNVVSTGNPSVLPYAINFEKSGHTPYSGTDLLRLKQPEDTPADANFLVVESGPTERLVIDGEGNLITKGGADIIANSSLTVQSTGWGCWSEHNNTNTGSYTNYYNTDAIRTLYIRSGTDAATQGGEIVGYTATGTQTFSLDANDGTGANLTLEESGGTATAILNASDGNGAVLTLKNNAGTTKVTVTSDFGGTGDSRLTIDELVLNGGSDFAEMFDVVDGSLDNDNIEPGMVVSIDPEMPGRLRVCDEAYDKKVAGIISGAGGVKPGLMMGDDRTLASGDYPVALSGRVYVKAKDIGGHIEPGDFLTTSPVPGYAMKAKDAERARGAIIGKAMTALEAEEGLVLVLVSLQ